MPTGPPHRVRISSKKCSRSALSGSPRILVVPDSFGVRSNHYERRHLLGIRRGVEAGKRATLGMAAEHRVSELTASRTARTSSIRCSRVGSSLTGTRSESPVPRLSKRIRREKDASRDRNRANRGSAQKYSRCDTQPITKTRSIGPSPTT